MMPHIQRVNELRIANFDFTILLSECVRNLDLRVQEAGASWRALDLKTAGAHSARSLKVSGCIR